MREYRALVQPQRVSKLDDVGAAISAWEALKRRVVDAQHVPVPDGFRKVAFRGLCPRELSEKVSDMAHQLVTSQQVKYYWPTSLIVGAGTRRCNSGMCGLRRPGPRSPRNTSTACTPRARAKAKARAVNAIGAGAVKHIRTRNT